MSWDWCVDVPLFVRWRYVFVPKTAAKCRYRRCRVRTRNPFRAGPAVSTWSGRRFERLTLRTALELGQVAAPPNSTHATAASPCCRARLLTGKNTKERYAREFSTKHSLSN